MSTEDCADALQTLYHNANVYAENLKHSLAEKIEENRTLKENAAPVILDQILHKVDALSIQVERHVNGLAPDGYPVKFNTGGRYQFIGENSSMGLVHGQIYYLTVSRMEGQRRIWARWVDAADKRPRKFPFIMPEHEKTRACPYDSAQLFEKNWKRIGGSGL